MQSLEALREDVLHRLHRRGRATLLVGAGLLAAALPAGLATTAAMEIDCQFECMSATFGGAAVFSGLTVASAVTFGVGGVQFALAPSRATHHARETCAAGAGGRGRSRTTPRRPVP